MREGGVTIRGVEGRLYWGYLPVGTVRAWTVTRHSPADPGTLTGTVVDVHPYRASQHPIEFVVTHKHGVWRWPLATLQIADTSVSATLRPPE